MRRIDLYSIDWLDDQSVKWRYRDAAQNEVLEAAM
jgi:hypothetical protein